MSLVLSSKKFVQLNEFIYSLTVYIDLSKPVVFYNNLVPGWLTINDRSFNTSYYYDLYDINGKHNGWSNEMFFGLDEFFILRFSIGAGKGRMIFELDTRDYK